MDAQTFMVLIVLRFSNMLVHLVGTGVRCGSRFGLLIVLQLCYVAAYEFAIDKIDGAYHGIQARRFNRIDK